MKHEYLPEGWRWTKLGDVLEQQYRQEKLLEGTDYTTLGVRWYAGGTFIKQERDGDDISASYLNRVEEGDFIYNRLFAWKGSFAIVPSEHAGYHVSNEFPVFKIKMPDQVDLNYLLWYTKRTHFWEYIATLSTGTSNASRLRYKEDDLLREAIPLPPIDEQRQIAEVLHDAEANIIRVEAQIKTVQEVKRGVMQRLFTYGLAGESTLTKETDAGEIPKHWLIEPLKNHTESSAFGPRFPANAYSDTGNVATLRTTDIHDSGEINYETMPRAKLNLDNFKSHVLKKGDLTITRSGTIGVVSVFEGYKLPVLPGAFLIRFRLRISIAPNFLKQYLNSNLGRRRVLDIAAGGVQKNLQGSAMLLLKIPVPPIQEQLEIAAILDAHDDIVRNLQAEAASLREIKHGLMQKLLSGQVRL